MIEPDGAELSPLHFEEEAVQIVMAQGPSAFRDEDGDVSFMMDVDMLTQFADEAVASNAWPSQTVSFTGGPETLPRRRLRR